MTDHRLPHAAAPRASVPRVRAGRCYELSLNHVLANPRWSLVHGTVDYVRTLRMGHAWLKAGGRIFDPSCGIGCAALDFAALVGAREHFVYSAAEAAEEMLRTGHCGPWADDHPVCVFFQWSKSR